jgi:ribulose-phosphate 3-epimerase
VTRIVRIAPSLLSADFSRLRDDIAMCEAGGADWLHVDVMDGHFVPNLTFGAKIIETVRALTDLPLDVHMMVERPSQFFDDFAKAGASGMTVHVEASRHIHRDICRVKELGCWAGVVINPGTPVSALSAIATEVDLVLIMSVDPGYGGQAFIPTSIEKIRAARAMLDNVGSPATLEVDGGITRETIVRAAAAGADAFVAGHAIFSAPDPRAEIGELRRHTLVTV